MLFFIKDSVILFLDFAVNKRLPNTSITENYSKAIEGNVMCLLFFVKLKYSKKIYYILHKISYIFKV